MFKLQVVGSHDRISNLPNSVTEIILMCLSTRDAVRTSILSRKWRHVWTKLPQCVLDKTFWKDVGENVSAELSLTVILNHLLMPHDGPLKKFTLSNPELRSCPEIDNLIRFLVKSRLEDFTLKMWKDCYLLPSTFFSCGMLRHLRLRSCSIRSSPAYEGFTRLTTLTLTEVTISAEMLASLISGSPLLHKLKLRMSSSIDICIDAPMLKEFVFVGRTKSINFKRVPLLASVSIVLDDPEATVNFVGVGCNMIKVFKILPSIQSLELSYHILQKYEGISHQRLPTSLIYLNVLKLVSISFNEMVELSFTFCLLRSSPNLKSIDILFEDCPDSDSKETTTYMEGLDYSDICLNELEEVKLKGVTGTKPELEFISLLLAKSSSLKKLEIQPKRGVVDNGFKIIKEVTRFRRLSKEAEILFLE